MVSGCRVFELFSCAQSPCKIVGIPECRLYVSFELQRDTILRQCSSDAGNRVAVVYIFVLSLVNKTF